MICLCLCWVHRADGMFCTGEEATLALRLTGGLVENETPVPMCEPCGSWWLAHRADRATLAGTPCDHPRKKDGVAHWRTGRSLGGRTLYRQYSADPSKQDQLVGFTDSDDYGRLIVAAVNAHLSDAPVQPQSALTRWVIVGTRTVHQGDGGPYVARMETPFLANLVVEAVNAYNGHR